MVGRGRTGNSTDLSWSRYLSPVECCERHRLAARRRRIGILPVSPEEQMTGRMPILRTPHYLSFRLAKAAIASNAAEIQKRTTIFISWWPLNR